LCQGASPNICCCIAWWSMTGIRWDCQDSLILVIIAWRRHRFYRLIIPDRTFSLWDIIECMVVFLHLEILTAPMFHVYARQLCILNSIFNKHVRSRFDSLRHFVTPCCTNLRPIPRFLPNHILLLVPIFPMIFLHSCVWRRIIITIVITHIETLTFDFLWRCYIVTTITLCIRPWNRWVVKLWLLVSLLHQEFIMERPSIVVLVTAIGVKLRRTVTLHHSCMRLSNGFPSWII